MTHTQLICFTISLFGGVAIGIGVQKVKSLRSRIR